MIAIYYLIVGFLFSAAFTLGRIWESGFKDCQVTFGGILVESLIWPVMIGLSLFIVIDDVRGRD